MDLDEKLRQAYFWIVNHGDHQPALRHRVQRRPAAGVPASATRKARADAAHRRRATRASCCCRCSTFAVRRKCLFVGGPGRGKTASAMLMGVLAGYPLREVQPRACSTASRR
ncbi:MAG: hypothetical protein V9E84_06480 [Trichococcus flocculiformis]